MSSTNSKLPAQLPFPLGSPAAAPPPVLWVGVASSQGSGNWTPASDLDPILADLPVIFWEASRAPQGVADWLTNFGNLPAIFWPPGAGAPPTWQGIAFAIGSFTIGAPSPNAFRGRETAEATYNVLMRGVAAGIAGAQGVFEPVTVVHTVAAGIAGAQGVFKPGFLAIMKGRSQAQAFFTANQPSTTTTCLTGNSVPTTGGKLKNHAQ